MKKKNMFYLQHKLPWQIDWIDIESANSEDVRNFIDILDEEPLHLIEIEYRIVAKESIKLRNKDKSTVHLKCVMTGKEIVSNIKKIKSKNNEERSH
ncbi:MAG: hypothetical protein ACOCV1_03975 [Bacillota bacterium]